METVRIYYEDAYRTEFDAQVVSCEAWKGAWRIVLDRTAFYPEGGGQPADHGTLSLPDGTAVTVTDAHERDGIVLHTCDAPLDPGTAVHGRIDWARRFDHMQQHSGEHILSGILCEMFHCDNVGFHLGADTVTIDYDAPIPWEGAMEAERRANEAVWADRAVEIAYPTPEELSSMAYRSKKALTGLVRIVTFPGADRCACCGTHVARAGQAGPIKILSCQKFREGTRLEILCGRRAWSHLCAVWDQARAAGQRLSVKPEAVAGAVERLGTELEAAKGRGDRLETELFARIARDHAGAGDVLVFRDDLRPDGVRRLADAIARECGGLAAVFSGQDGGGHAYALVRADGGIVDVKEMDLTLHGRGGGRGGFAQGSVQADRGAVEAWWRDRT